MTIATAPTPAPTVPPDTSWRRGPGESQTHAFSIGPGWTRSACRIRAWSVTLLVDNYAPRCRECVDLIDGRIPEAELRALHGDR